MTTTILVLGGTGKTGSRIATHLRSAGLTVRTAARSGADIAFDWSDPATWSAALVGVDRIYLVPPALRLDFADVVVGFLDAAVEAGAQHVTYLSARGVDLAPPDAAMRAVEIDLTGRASLTTSILRPSFFMQNFTEGAFADQVGGGVLALPSGDGAEAFIDVDDIAAVAAASLQDPAQHAGAEYELTGPEALTHTQVAAALTAHGRTVRYRSVPLDQWVTAAVDAGMPLDYAGFLGGLLAGIGAGHGTRPTPDVLAATGRPPASFTDVLARAS